MKIDRLVLGEFETNCYVLRKSGDASECLLIDTGLDVGPLLEYLDKHKLAPVAVVITHGHIDHIAGIDTLREKFPSMAVCVHKSDANLLTDAVSNLSFMTGQSVTAGPALRLGSGQADCLVEEGDIIDRAGVKLLVIHTPGHTRGGICLYAEQDNAIFVGDTLFAGSIGRTDFPGGDMVRLIEGIKQKLLTLPEKTVVYPGHGPMTTIKREKAENPFLK